MSSPEGIRCILLDIEGTTTPISFVYDVLFPFAEARLAEFIKGAADGSAAAEAVEQLRLEYADETKCPELPSFGNGAAYAQFLMASDRKSTGLKAIQGLIWVEGYESGELLGQVFPDVPDALRAWHHSGLRLRVFSSGSVLAQRLLFGHTEHGDLTPYFEGFHDTNIGDKKHAAAYRAIAAAADLPPSDILFLSDVVEELDAAAEASLVTGLFRRPGNAAAEAGPHPCYESFAELA